MRFYQRFSVSHASKPTCNDRKYWSNLVSVFIDEEDEGDLAAFKDKLDKIMYEKWQNIDNKKVFFVKRQQMQDLMDESALKKRNQYAADMRKEQDWNAICTEERELHEAYQFCIREYKARHVEEVSISPQGSIKKQKRARRGADTVSVYKGEKDYYERLVESLPNQEPEFGNGPLNMCWTSNLYFQRPLFSGHDLSENTFAIFQSLHLNPHFLQKSLAQDKCSFFTLLNLPIWLLFQSKYSFLNTYYIVHTYVITHLFIN